MFKLNSDRYNWFEFADEVIGILIGLEVVTLLVQLILVS